MHWLLSISDDFSLREVIRRSGWLLHPPFHVPSLTGRLTRVELLDGENAVELVVSQAPAGLVVQTTARLSGQEIQDASQRVWRMLRLDENFRPFLRLARRSEALAPSVRSDARLLRGTTLFEDVLTAALATWHAGPGGRGAGTQLLGALRPGFELVVAMVDRLGTPLPANPTLHTFPGPERILAHSEVLPSIFPADLAEQALRIARLLAEGTELTELVRRPVSATKLAQDLRELTGIAPPNLGLLMLNLSRYDYVPTDWIAREQLRRYRDSLGSGEHDVTGQDILRFFDRWQPWGGLAYWLWDWSKVSNSVVLKAEG
ncbi:MAG: hypothetical protein ACP5HG_01600 [Anaerolineae bacterium]